MCHWISIYAIIHMTTGVLYNSAAHQVIYIYYNRTTFMSRRINIHVLCMIFKLRLSFLFNDVAPKAIFDAQYFTHEWKSPVWPHHFTKREVLGQWNKISASVFEWIRYRFRLRFSSFRLELDTFLKAWWGFLYLILL